MLKTVPSPTFSFCANLISMPASKSRTINLLESSTAPVNTWDRIYDWVFSVGRYIIIAVELVVVLAFASRFYFDRQNNDLKESINTKVQMLQAQASFERQMRVVQSVLGALSDRLEKQYPMSSTLSDIYSEVPSSVEVKSFSMTQQVVNMNCRAPSYDIVQQLESNLNSNANYSDVTVSLSKGGTGSSVSFTITMNLAKK